MSQTKAQLVDNTKVTYTASGTGAAARTVDSKLGDAVSVKDFGAVGNGVANDSAAIQAAIDTGKKVYIPSGTYLCNVVINNKTIIEGDGSTATILTPFSVTTAAMTYRSSGPYWTYHSEVKGIGFHGIGTKTGVGFTFSKTDPSLYAVGDEYANNVKFVGCRFYNLNKGVQFPFGNIGSEFYSCGFAANKYGVYAINNKFGGDVMQPGCKYFYAGEFNSNECAVYVHDTFGAGAFAFRDTILEVNLIAMYAYSSGYAPVTPFLFDGVWVEANGQVSPGATTVTIDNWSGSTRSDQTLTKRTFIFDGNGNRAQFRSCGVVGDIYLKGIRSSVFVKSCRVENEVGYGGGPCTVETPGSSVIHVIDPFASTVMLKGNSIITTGRPCIADDTIASSGFSSYGRWFITEPRGAKLTSYGPAKVVTAPLNTVASTGGGSFGLTGTVVSDGRIYSQCNEFTRAAFTSAEFTRLTSPDSAVNTTVEGWYLFTLDFKRTAGNPIVYVWDRGSALLVTSMQAPTLNKWYTFAALAYSPGGQLLFLDFSGSNVTETCTWRISAYQMLRFDTLEQAQSFLVSGAFAES
jgi:hypothetical protein